MIDLADFVPKPHKDGEFVYRFIGASDLQCVEQIEATEEWLEGQVAGKLRNGDFALWQWITIQDPHRRFEMSTCPGKNQQVFRRECLVEQIRQIDIGERDWEAN
jgi:hypothetical protein